MNPPASQWEGFPTWLVAIGAVSIAMMVMGYVYGIPLLARAVADRVPSSAVERLSASTLAALDRDVLQPTVVPLGRRRELDAAFARLAKAGGSTNAYRLVFRKSEAIGANAMALPSGTIVITDGLMALAKDDRELLGVLAHEAGHVDERHGLRGLLQRSLAGLLVAWFAGDLSSIAAAAPAALLDASYSRALEREADDYAVRLLRANGIPLQHFANILRRLDQASGAAGTPAALAYLSSHPATSERLARLDDRR